MKATSQKAGLAKPSFKSDIVHSAHPPNGIAADGNPAGGAVKLENFASLDQLFKKILLDHVKFVVVFDYPNQHRCAPFGLTVKAIIINIIFSS